MCGVLLASTPAAVRAATVVVKVLAVNPSALERRKVPVKAYLPRAARPQDVQDAAGLEVAYDVQSQAYYVHGEFELETNQVRVFEVTLQDIWLIASEQLQALREQADQLSDALKKTDQGPTAERLKATLQASLQEVESRQREHALDRAKPADHIRAYEANLEALERVRKDIGVLENLALAAGIEPRRILGGPAVPPAPPALEPSAESTNRPLVLAIQVRNPSLTGTSTNSVRRELPSELVPSDVLDADGLATGFDAARRVVYVYMDELPLAPQEERVFQVRLRNPWAEAGARVALLSGRASNVLAVARREEAQSAADLAQDLLRELEGLESLGVPASLDESYVAAERERAKRLGEIDGRVARLEELFQPRNPPLWGPLPPKPVVRPPDERTTWILIWSILGFLFVLSALFFLRWYGKSKVERAVSKGEGVSEPDGTR